MVEITLMRFRSFLPQILACMATIALTTDIGLSLSYPTVLISATTGLNNKTNPNETLEMTPNEVSWFASISYLGKIFGSLACGFVSQQFGHRNAMILINIPVFVSLYLFYSASSVWQLFAAITFLGFGCGYMKAPCVTYVTEISEVSIRGILVSLTSAGITFGPIVVILLGNLTPWRNIALYWCVIQLISVIMLCCIPESPLWLVSKQRDKSALRSLKWLRGWVPQSAVQTEFDAIKRYKDTSDSCNSCKQTNVKCTHIKKQTTLEAIRQLFHKRTIKPFFILTFMCGISFFSGTHHLNAYSVQILSKYRSPIDPNWALLIVGVIGSLGTVIGIFALKMLGKRKLYLIALTGCIFSSLILSIYGFMYLPANSKSYQKDSPPDLLSSADATQIPLIVFCLDRFCTVITLLVQFSMLSELYSLQTRSLATGITMVANNIMVLIATKSFYNFQKWFDLPTAMGIYCIIGVFGFIVIYKILPETEGCTLEDIELHFSNYNKKLTDHYIVRLSQNKKGVEKGPE